MADKYSRRSVIYSLLTGGLVVTSGCASDSDGDQAPPITTPTNTPTETSTPKPTEEPVETETGSTDEPEEEQTPTPEPTPALVTLGDRAFSQANWFFNEMPRKRASLSAYASDLLSRTRELSQAPGEVTVDDIDSLHSDVQAHADRLSEVGTAHYATGEAISDYERPFDDFGAERRNEALTAVKDAIEFQDTDKIKNQLDKYWSTIPVPEWSPDHFSGLSFGGETPPGTALNIYHSRDGFDDELVSYGMFRLVHLVLGNLEGRASLTVTRPDIYFPRRDKRMIVGGGGQSRETLRTRANRYRQPFNAQAADDEIFWTAEITGERFDNRFSEGLLYQFADEASASEAYATFIESAPTDGTESFNIGEADKVGLVAGSSSADTLYAYGIQRGSYVLLFNGHVQRWGERGFKNDIGLYSYNGSL